MTQAHEPGGGTDKDELRDYFEPKTAEVVDVEPPQTAEAIQDSIEVEVVATPGAPPLLPTPARTALQRLLMKGAVFGRTHRQDYDQLLVHRDDVGRVLAELGLAINVSTEYAMAVLTRVDDVNALADQDDLNDDSDEDDDDANRALVRTTRLKLLHSIVLMVLRMYFRERERARDQIVIIDLENLKDRIKPFWPLLNAESRSDRRLSGAIATLERHSILLSVRENKDQREISPVITLAMSSTKLNTYLSECQRLLDELSKDSKEASE